MLAKVRSVAEASYVVDTQRCADLFRQGTLHLQAPCTPRLMLKQNKPNGQFKLDFKPEAIKAFMHDLSIRKVPGVGRVHERLLDSIGIKVIFFLDANVHHC